MSRPSSAFVPGRVYELTPATYAAWGASQLADAVERREFEAAVTGLASTYTPN